MASVYSPWGPSTGPGQFNAYVAPYYTFSATYTGVIPGYGYASNLGLNNTPNPGPPAADQNGILLENSANEFLALEVGSGGPASFLTRE